VSASVCGLYDGQKREHNVILAQKNGFLPDLCGVKIPCAWEPCLWRHGTHACGVGREGATRIRPAIEVYLLGASDPQPPAVPTTPPPRDLAVAREDDVALVSALVHHPNGSSGQRRLELRRQCAGQSNTDTGYEAGTALADWGAQQREQRADIWIRPVPLLYPYAARMTPTRPLPTGAR